MEEPEDVDMTMSTTLPAQNHDRQDDAMEEDVEAAPLVVSQGDRTSSGSDEPSRRGEANEDAMDTTPDPTPQPETLSHPQSSQADPQATQSPIATMPPPAATDAASGDSSSQVSTPPANAQGNAEGDRAGSEVSQQPSNPGSEPMPPPQHSQHDDSSSEDSDDDILQWHEVIQDMSVPDEDELKEIESSTERSATDGKSFNAEFRFSRG